MRVDGDRQQPITDYCASIRLDGKGFVVLGGGQGIGRETCRALAQAGAEILCVDLKLELAQPVAQEVNGHACEADVTKAPEMRRVFDDARKIFGGRFGGVVDIVGMGDLRTIAEMDEPAWDRQYDLLLRHAFLAIKYGAETLPAAGGAMVFVSSFSGLRSAEGQAVYGSAKAALNHLAVCAAHEYGPKNIRINVVAPGLTRTPRVVAGFGEALIDEIVERIPLRRANEPDDIAKAILFLSSDLARCVTGVVLPVDGGLINVAALPPIKVGEALLRRETRP
jgi:3alpha(or 20beta)-hydroxysteroid dehydrogenase